MTSGQGRHQGPRSPSSAPAATRPTPREAAHDPIPGPRPSEDQFHAIFEGVTDGILIYDPTGRILEVNPVVCQRLGFSRAELLQKKVPDVDAPGSAALFEQRVQLVLDRGFATYDVEHVRRDGSTVALEVGSRAIDFGGTRAVLSVQRDVTERRRQQTAAEEQRRYIEQVLDAIPTPVVAKDAEGRIQHCNSAFLESWNLTRDRAIGKSIQELGLPHGDAYKALDREVIETGGLRQHEAWLPLANGPRRMIMTRAPLRQSNGGIRGTITTAFDITERYLVEQALRQSEERARTLFESAGDAIFIADLDGRFVDVNVSAAAALGYTRDELLRMGIGDVSPTAGPAGPRYLMEAVIEKGRVRFETTHRRRDGTLIPVEVTATATELEGRKVVLGIARDISERKHAEAERSLLESQLRQAQKMEGIGRLASGIAHDFNNLLTAIGGFAGLAMAGLGEDDERRHDIDQIQQASARAAKLVRQLLEFARVNKGEPRVVTPGLVVARLESLLRPIIGEEIELVFDTDGCHGNVLADPGQIEQVIVNLVVNASDAMPHGGRLTIRTADVALGEDLAIATGGTPGDSVLIEVADTGTGMDAATMEHLFEPFFTTKGPGEGTGLGLATVYGIVRNWGGGLHVQSEPGRGSTFGVYLPCVALVADAQASMPVVPAAAPAARGKRILVVEDDESVRGFAGRVLQGAGYQVYAPQTAPLAVELGRGLALDLLLTDIVMPTMRGAEVAAELRRLNPGLPVLYMSGYSDRNLDESGPTSYLAKPFSADELLRAIERALVPRPAR